MHSAISLILALIMSVPMVNPQAERVTSPAVEEHIHELIKMLPTDSGLGRALVRGARGDGVHFAWMDEMRKQGIKRADVWVDIRFDRHSRPKQLTVGRIRYFAAYEGGMPISESERLDAFRTGGSEIELSKLALQRATHSYWFERPRAKPNPFVGGIGMEFFDDEWLPDVPGLYCAGSACASNWNRLANRNM